MKINKGRVARFAIIVLLLSALACNTLVSPNTSTTPRSIGEMTIIVGGTLVDYNSTNIYLSNNKTGGNSMTEFAPSDTVYILIDATGVPLGTKYEVNWYELNVADQDPNTPVANSKLTYKGASDTVTAWLGAASGLPAADYKVEVLKDNVRIGSIQFSVKP